MFLMPKKKTSKTIFGENLSRIRLSRGMNQIQLAEAIRSTQRAISSYETGECYPPLPVVTALAKILKCSVDELLGARLIKQLKEKKDPKICDEIKDEFYHTDCLDNLTIYLAKLEKNKEKCGELIDKKRSDECRSAAQ